MPSDFLMVLGITLAAALASPLGGFIATIVKPSSLLLSAAVGMAAGVLIATFAFEMLPKALELGSLPVAVGGFAVGFACVYALDLFLFRGVVSGEQAEQRRRVERFHARHRPRGGKTIVLAAGTSAEELIEGITIGLGAAIDPSVGLLVAIAICIDNLSEGLSIGELFQADSAGDGDPKWRILGWTSLIGVSLLVSSLAGWFLLRDLPQPVLGFLFALGAGALFYLAVTNLIPQADKRQFQQSSGIAAGIGFLLMFCLSELMG